MNKNQNYPTLALKSCFSVGLVGIVVGLVGLVGMVGLVLGGNLSSSWDEGKMIPSPP